MAGVVEPIQAALQDALPPGRQDRAALLRGAWASLDDVAYDRHFAVLVELFGLAATGIEPYAALARSVIVGWTDWFAERIDGPSDNVRREEAASAIALIDGLLVLRLIAGPAAGKAAAAHLLGG